MNGENSDSPTHPPEGDVGENTEETGSQSQNLEGIRETSTENSSTLDNQSSLKMKTFKYKFSHPTELIISDLSKGIQTRNSVLQIFCANHAFLSNVEPTDYKVDLTDLDWVLAMQDELNQFERNKVWHLEARTSELSVIRTK